MKPPKGVDYPMLPLPKNFCIKVPFYLFLAELNGEGTFSVSYQINNGKFEVTVSFSSKEAETIPLAIHTIDYNPRDYSTKEALWIYWLGRSKTSNSCNDVNVNRIYREEIKGGFATIDNWTPNFYPSAGKIHELPNLKFGDGLQENKDFVVLNITREEENHVLKRKLTSLLTAGGDDDLYSAAIAYDLAGKELLLAIHFIARERMLDKEELLHKFFHEGIYLTNLNQVVDLLSRSTIKASAVITALDETEKQLIEVKRHVHNEEILEQPYEALQRYGLEVVAALHCDPCYLASKHVKDLCALIDETTGLLDPLQRRTQRSSPNPAETAFFHREKSNSPKGRKPTSSANPPEREFFPEEELNIPAGLKLARVPSDGSCFYHAIALYLGVTAADLRERVADYLENHDDGEMREFIGLANEVDLADYVQGIRNGEWGDNITLAVMAKILSCPIAILGKDGCLHSGSIIEGYENIHETIFIRYDGIHYDGLVLTGTRAAEDILQDLPGFAHRQAPQMV